MQTFTSDTFRQVVNKAGSWLCIRCSRPGWIIQSLKEGRSYDVELKLHREKRSKDMNAYFWVLADKMAVVLSERKQRPVTKVEVYRRLVPDVPGVSVTLPMKDQAVETFCRIWEDHGIGWLTETIPSNLPGITAVVAYYGSSTYDTAQMTRLIDLAVAECKELGIETLTPEELARMEGYDAEA